MKEKKKIPTWAVVLIVIAIIGIIGSFGNSSNESNNDSNKENNTSTKTTEKKELTLEDGWTASLDDTGYFYYIEGYITNPTDKDYSYVQVEFTSYDSEGNTLGTCIDNNSGLEKDGRWKFKAACLESVENIANVKLKEISGY